MKNEHNFYVNSFLNSLTYIFMLFLFTVLTSVNTYSQILDSPHDGISGVCYASTGIIDSGRILTIDIKSGVGTLIGPSGLTAVPGLAINSNGDMYGIDGAFGGNFDLYKIDAAMGKAVFVGSPGLASLPAIAFDGNDVLYGLGLDPVTFVFNLYTINITSGVPTLVGPAPMGNWRGMAFDPITGTIWASTSDDSIYVIDPNTGTPTLIGTTGLGVGTPDIHFDEMGNLYGATGGGRGGPNNFISIDKTTGAGTIIGSIGFTSVSGLSFFDKLVSVEDDETANVPRVHDLLQNYPNPFNPSTIINYQIPNPGYVTLIVYDVLGNEIAILVDEEKSEGSYEFKFNAIRLPSGIYFYRLQAGDPSTGSGQSFVETKKMVLLR